MTPSAPRINNRIGGFTLIELMVAITISLIILSGLSFILVGSHKTHRIQSGLQDLQENGRIGLEMIARDVRGAGYVGCSEGGITFTNHLNSTVAIPAAVKGFEHSTTGSGIKWYPSDSTDPDIPPADHNSDSFVITYASPTGRTVAAITGTETTVTLDDVDGLFEGDILYLSNCKGSDLFQVSDVSDPADGAPFTVEHIAGGELDPGNATEILGNAYLPGDNILRFSVSLYFVKEDPLNGNLPTLFWAPNNNLDDAQAYIPGVENMQVLYGEDTGGSSAVDTYIQADDVSNWDNVRTIRLALLLRTEAEYGTSIDTNNFADNDHKVDVLDYEYVVDEDTRHRWRAYTTTMEIRNGY